MTIRDMERTLIYRTLEEVSYNRTKAAHLLGITDRTLRNKLNEYKKNPVLESQKEHGISFPCEFIKEDLIGAIEKHESLLQKLYLHFDKKFGSENERVDRKIKEMKKVLNALSVINMEG